jgi:hypothetical protein
MIMGDIYDLQLTKETAEITKKSIQQKLLDYTHTDRERQYLADY